jgi:hypothetical protein
MEGRPPYELLSDRDLKREVDDLVSAWKSAPEEARPALARDAEVLRDELRKRLEGPGYGGWEPDGVREPRRPRPSGSAAGAVVDP